MFQNNPNVPVTQECLDQNLLEAGERSGAEGMWRRLPTLKSSSSCRTTSCGLVSFEPLSPQAQSLRASTCTLDNTKVEAILPRASSNPTNVKNVEKILPESKFNELFPKRSPAYTYLNFLKAVGKYPAICSTASSCPRILAAMFAHFEQETAGLFYTEEINQSDYCAEWSAWVAEAYPCVPGRKYYGRGAKQLTWNFNYGAFSRAMFGDAKVLLEQPELVASTWLNFASALWFFVTPQPPKPSMMQVLDGSWKPNAQDSAAGLQPGFGATTMVINGGLECGASPSNPTGAANRERYYREFSAKLGVDIRGEKLGCRDSQAFPQAGSAGAVALYWAREQGCRLVTWQTAFSALVEGDHDACKGGAASCSPILPSSNTGTPPSTTSKPGPPLQTTSNPGPPRPTTSKAPPSLPSPPPAAPKHRTK